MEDTLKERFEAIYYGIVGTYPDSYDLETMHQAYNLALSEKIELWHKVNDVHTALAKTGLDMEQYEPISLILIGIKQELLPTPPQTKD